MSTSRSAFGNLSDLLLIMTYRTFTFPQFPEYCVFAAYYDNLTAETLSKVKSELVGGNKNYDYCFASTTHLISVDQLCSSIHRSIQNDVLQRMKAKTLNTEILYNLSPTNNINEALKRFGVDEGRLDIIVLKVFKNEKSDQLVLQNLNEELDNLLGGESVTVLSDSTFLKAVDLKKFLKLFKIQNANEDLIKAQLLYAEEAVAASLLRGC